MVGDKSGLICSEVISQDILAKLVIFVADSGWPVTRLPYARDAPAAGPQDLASHDSVRSRQRHTDTSQMSCAQRVTLSCAQSKQKETLCTQKHSARTAHTARRHWLLAQQSVAPLHAEKPQRTQHSSSCQCTGGALAFCAHAQAMAYSI